MLVTLVVHDDLPSTMDAVHELAQQGAPHGTAVRARRQTAGRGTRGRRWASDEGGLWVSVVARPSRTDALEALSVRVGLAVARAIEVACAGLGGLGMKWPNDLWLDGGKVAGVLSEARWSGDVCQWVAIGVGINVDNTVRDEPGARSLRDGGVRVGADALAEPVARAVAVAASDAGPLSPAELAEFDARDVLRGRLVLEPAHGIADGITRRGTLKVRRADNTIDEVLAGLVLAH